MFDEDEKSSSDSSYVFCPAPHRHQFLDLFTKHFCQHSLFIDRHFTESQNAKTIRLEAVHEMYMFCKTRGLAEVWGYMWACWYNSKMWKIWARSASPLISRLRTTMGVENFWRQLKHNYLHNVPRPRLDQLIWILIFRVSPSYQVRAQLLNEDYRKGRSKALTPYQVFFKASWKELKDKECSGRVYSTDIKQWVCNCGQQKYNCHHICKHLVQTVPTPPSDFWTSIVRRRTLPLYRHSLLSNTQDVDDFDGSITDGDDDVISFTPQLTGM